MVVESVSVEHTLAPERIMARAARMQTRGTDWHPMKKPSAYRQWRTARKIKRFLRTGMKPWTKGYEEYKVSEIRRSLREGTFSNDKLPAGYGYRIDERIIEYPWFFSRLPSGAGKLLDAGSALNFDFLLDQPKLKEKRVHICTLAPEDHAFWNKGVSYVYEDLRTLPYKDEGFDWISCISTIEHVGMDNTMLYTSDTTKRESSPKGYIDAIIEMRRVVKPGGTLFLTVPYGKAAHHGWFQFFDEAMVDSIADAFKATAQRRFYFAYEPEGWRVATAAETKDATGFDFHAAKGYDPDFAAGSRAVCCIEMVK
jgi:SAM-dependent methyltransferase